MDVGFRKAEGVGTRHRRTRLRLGYGGSSPGFELPLEEVRRTPDPVSSVSTHYSAVRYQVTENMNRRTAEYRS